MHASQKNHPLSLNTHKMVNEEDMQKALAEIESSEAPDYAAIARKYGLTRSTLSRRTRGLTILQAEFQSQLRQYLTNTQERILINQINYLTKHGIPLTSQIVKNFAEKIIGYTIGKN
jgi:hypothetical protein